MQDDESDDRGPSPESESADSGSIEPGAGADVGERTLARDRSATNSGRSASRARLPRRNTLTAILLGANVAVFAAMVLGGVAVLGPTRKQTLAWGANFGPL